MKKKQEEFKLPDSLGGLAEQCDELWTKVVDETDAKKQKALVEQYNITAGAYNEIAGEARMTIITKDTILSSIRPESEDALPTKTTGKARKVVDAVKGKRDHNVGDIIKICFAGSRIDVIIETITEWDTFKVKGGDGVKYHVKREDIIQGDETAAQHIARNKIQKPVKEEKVKTERAPRKASKSGGDVPPPSVANRKLESMKKSPALEKILKQDVAGAVMIREAFDLDPKTFNVLDFETISGIPKGRIIGCLKKYDKAKNFKL